jgi:hypothetical protein
MLLAVSIASMLWLGTAAAEESSEAQTTAKKTRPQSGNKVKKVIRLEAITVEGRIQKPQAFYILPRSNLNFDELNRTESFVPKVIKSVDKEPF